MTTKFKQPKGGALVFVLMVFVAVSLYCLYFVYDVTKTQIESNEFVYEQNIGSVIDSGLNHAKFLLETDLKLGPADDYRDIWVSVPRGKVLPTRLSWSEYISVPTNLENQKWFEFSGPTPATTLRYRFKLIDMQPVKIENCKSKIESLIPKQPNTPAVWHNNKWIKTDDILSVNVKGAQDLINKFETGSTSDSGTSRKLSRIIDLADNNYAVNEFGSQNSEPIQFDRIVTQTDSRWEHFDDTMRLGRYYEERGKHNFFLINDHSMFFNKTTRVTNTIVTLKDEPVNSNNLYGWESYKKFRKDTNLPWWHKDMWEGTEALTGAGSLLKRQPVKSNSETNTLYFADSESARYTDGQTITFNNWFSSLHARMRVKYKSDGAKELGAVFTAETEAPDSIILTNISANERYRITLVSGRNYNNSLDAPVSISGVAGYQKTSFDTNGFALLKEGEPLSGKVHSKGGYLELLIKSPKKFPGLFSLEGALLEQPEFIVLRNLSDKPVNIGGHLMLKKFALITAVAALSVQNVYAGMEEAKKCKKSRLFAKIAPENL